MCVGLSSTSNHKTDGLLMVFLSTAAVCDFCKKRESELYQKEVGSVFLCLNLGKLVFISEAEDCLCLLDRSSVDSRREILTSVDSVSALSRFTA